jgi:hypothetical protein
MPGESPAPPARSEPGVFDLERHPAAEGAPRLLIEVPHGATSASHFDALRARLVGSYPDDLREFFFVNTDVGAPETAREIARRAAAAGIDVLVVRCLIPRTFIDVNRGLEAGAHDNSATGLTPGLPEWVSDPHDRDLLRGLYVRYQRAAREAFDAVCGGQGLALTLHSYAPRSVEIDDAGIRIAAALRDAYRPERYEEWPRRPAVEIIDSSPQGECLSSPALIEAVEREFASIGIAVERNRTYRLDPVTSGHAHAARHPGRVLCVEINRELLADPFDPFVEMRISAARATRMAVPLAAALVSQLRSR